MAKFNENKITDLFNSETREEIESEFRVIYVDIYDIVANERNKDISMDDIEELSENIELIGLQQNLVLAPPKDGKFLLLAGHRRLAALKMLVEEKGLEQFKKVPAIINDPDNFQYQLSDEKKEDLLWVSSNITARKPTPQDLLKFVTILNDVYAELKENNPDITVGTKKEYIAKQLSVSESQVQILNSIGSHLTEKALNAFLNEKLSLVVARDLAKMSSKNQDAFMSEFDDLSQATLDDLIVFKRKLAKAQTETGPVDVVTDVDFDTMQYLLDKITSKLTTKNIREENTLKARKLIRETERNLNRILKLL